MHVHVHGVRRKVVFEWLQVIGHSGVVSKVSSRSISVDAGPRRYKWHPSVVKFIAKGSEVVEAISKRQ